MGPPLPPESLGKGLPHASARAVLGPFPGSGSGSAQIYQIQHQQLMDPLVVAPDALQLTPELEGGPASGRAPLSGGPHGGGPPPGQQQQRSVGGGSLPSIASASPLYQTAAGQAPPSSSAPPLTTRTAQTPATGSHPSVLRSLPRISAPAPRLQLQQHQQQGLPPQTPGWSLQTPAAAAGRPPALTPATAAAPGSGPASAGQWGAATAAGAVPPPPGQWGAAAVVPNPPAAQWGAAVGNPPTLESGRSRPGQGGLSWLPVPVPADQGKENKGAAAVSLAGGRAAPLRGPACSNNPSRPSVLRGTGDEPSLSDLEDSSEDVAGAQGLRPAPKRQRVQQPQPRVVKQEEHEVFVITDDEDDADADADAGSSGQQQQSVDKVWGASAGGSAVACPWQQLSNGMVPEHDADVVLGTAVPEHESACRPLLGLRGGLDDPPPLMHISAVSLGETKAITMHWERQPPSPLTLS